MELSRQSRLPLYPILLVFFEVVAYLSNDLYLPALPQITQDFNASNALAQMTLTAWFLGSASLLLILGPLSDRVGRRPIILGGVFVFVISTFLCALSTHIEMLIIARLIQGMSICSIGSAGYATVHELYDQKVAIQFIALMAAITLLAPALGPLTGALLLHFMSWRWLFWILAFLGLLSGILLWRWMPESLPIDKRHPLIWRVTMKQYLHILQNKRFIGFSLLVCLPMLSSMAWLTVGPFMFMETWHYSSYVFGVSQLAVFGAIMLGSILVKPLMHYFGVLPLITVASRSMTISAVCALLLSLFLPTYLLGFVLIFMLFVFSTSLMWSPAQRLAIETLTEPMGVRMAMFSSLTAFFGFIGSFLASTTYNGTLLWMAIILVTAAAIVLPIQIMQRN